MVEDIVVIDARIDLLITAGHAKRNHLFLT